MPSAENHILQTRADAFSKRGGLLQALSRCWRKLNGRLTIAPSRADPPLSSLQAMEDALTARSIEFVAPTDRHLGGVLLVPRSHDASGPPNCFRCDPGVYYLFQESILAGNAADGEESHFAK